MKRLALLMLAGCSGGVSGLGGPAEPLVVLEGRFTGTSTFAAPRVGLMWTRAQVFEPYCHLFGPNPEAPNRHISRLAGEGCFHPYDVVPALAGPSVPLVDGRFTLPITALPPAEVLVGPREARVAYASIVMFDDANGDGQQDLARSCGGRGTGRRAEPIAASSFASLAEEQVRLTYVEGPFDAGSFFYPHPGCAALPPAGYSLWRVGPYEDRAAGCEVLPIDRAIELPSRVENARLGCEQRDRDSYPRPPPMRAPDRRTLTECTLGGALAVVDPRCPCPSVQLYTLAGCYDDLVCETPEWDVRAAPPEWWPCPVRGP